MTGLVPSPLPFLFEFDTTVLIQLSLFEGIFLKLTLGITESILIHFARLNINRFDMLAVLAKDIL